MSGVAATLLGWLVAHTYAVVLVGTLIDASGMPFPGRLFLIAAGAVAGTGGRSLVVIILLGAVAATVMDHVWHLAAARGSESLVRFYRRLSGWSGAEPDAARTYFARYGAAIIFVGRFFTGVRVLAWPMAAAHGLGYPTFLVLDLLAALAGPRSGSRSEGSLESAGPGPRRRPPAGRHAPWATTPSASRPARLSRRCSGVSRGRLPRGP